jgi:excisionase family DNA binding protein
VNDILSIDEFCKLTGCEPDTAREKARNREIPGIKLGRDWVFPRVALLETLNELARGNLKPKDVPQATQRETRRSVAPLPKFPTIP